MNKNLIREKNLMKIKHYLFCKRSALKSEISNDTGISVVTVNSLVKQLVEENVIIEGEMVQPSLGRPAVTLHFNYDQELFLLMSVQEKAVNLMRELLIVGRIVNLAGEVKFSESFDFSPIELGSLIAKIDYFLGQTETVKKIGLSIPGKVYNDIIVSSWESGMDGWNIQDAVSNLTDVPIVIENDANLLTVGETIHCGLSKEDTIVGVFYPENSMPGITIYDSGCILSGQHNLAGEAKYLPNLINNGMPINNIELLNNLVDILSIYNAVIAPHTFIVSADSIEQANLLDEIKNSSVLNQQINRPNIVFIENFDEALNKGLLWLVTKDSSYVEL